MSMDEEDLMKNWNKKKVYFNALPKPAIYTKEKQLSVDDFIFEESQNHHARYNARLKQSMNTEKDNRIKELEQEIADLKTEIEMLKAVNQEC
jgi:hypothetical protein